MPLARVLNVTYALLIEGMDADAVKRLDQAMLGEVKPDSPSEAFNRARAAQPRRGAPVDFKQQQKQLAAPPEGPPSTPPPMPEGYKLAPVGVQIREPSPTRGLEVLDAALGVAPRPSRARPAVPRGPAHG